MREGITYLCISTGLFGKKVILGERKNQPRGKGLPKGRSSFRLGLMRECRKQREIESVPDASRKLQHLLSSLGEFIDLAGYHVHNAVRQLPGLDLLQVPYPTTSIHVKLQYTVVVNTTQEFVDEKWISTRFCHCDFCK